MTHAQRRAYEGIFYPFWEKIFDEMPDEVMASTVALLKNPGTRSIVNDLIEDYHRYREGDGLIFDKEL
jgi:hypothetical protein